MDKPEKYYLTTPIYYANSRPHVGSAYTTIVCDVIARYKRMCGYDVAYLTGTDEHGVNIERAAEKLGISPQELVDRNQQIFRDLWKLLGIQYTDFIRTTSKEHAKAVQALILRTSKNAIEKRKYEGRYCIYNNLYVSDTPEPADCPICGRPGELVSEENYFFRLSAYQKQLLRLYRDNPGFVQPDFRLNEVISFVESGLKDVSISRKSIKWGISWPNDPEHVFYVWYDALTSYMSGIGFAEGDKGSAEFQKYWPPDVHMIGKEIIRFHAVYWPAFLMSAGLPLPKQIFAHGWLLMDSAKMSKSLGNVVRPRPIVNVLGLDALRYYLLRETVFGQDGNFSYDALAQRYNSDLANGLGILASRTAAMIDKNCDGKIPKPAALQPQDTALAKEGQNVIGEVLEQYNNFAFSLALESIWSLIAAADKYLTIEQPWALGASEADQQRRATVLWTTAEVLRIVTALAHPVLPESTARVWALLGQAGQLGAVNLEGLRWGQIGPGAALGKSQALFPRIDKAEAIERMEAMENEAQKQPAPAAPAATASAPAAVAAGTAAAPSAPEKIGIERSEERRG